MPNGKPSILVLGGDDIGITNLSCYSDGSMGYRTPFPPRQKAATFTIDQVVERLEAALTAGH